uniref:Aldehyde dehydrogenase domain-containing protein n=1 Tax=Denticeps clupeoides TaxID=299321 RepID=A0AAY4AWX2_9TELE
TICNLVFMALCGAPLRRAPLVAGVRRASSGSLLIREPLNYWRGGRVGLGAAEATQAVYEPATGRVLCRLQQCGAEEVDQAVQSARSAFLAWSRMAGMERARVMLDAARIVEMRREEIAELEAVNNGKSITEARLDEANSFPHLHLQHYHSVVTGTVPPWRHSGLSVLLRDTVVVSGV